MPAPDTVPDTAPQTSAPGTTGPLRDGSTARAAVEHAYRGVDLAALPDPEAPWYSSSTSDSHPGKRYHASAHCRDLSKVKHVNTYTRTAARIADRVCGRCWTDNRDPDRATGQTTRQLLALHRALLDVAAAIDAGGDRHEAIRTLSNLATRLGRHQDQPAGLAATSARDALADLLAASPDATEEARALTLLAAASLLGERNTDFTNGVTARSLLNGAPLTHRDTRLLGGAQAADGIRWSAHALKDPWTQFRYQLFTGASLERAREVARDSITLRDPEQVRQLRGVSFTVPEGTTTFSLDDVIGQWHEQAKSLYDAELTEWVQRTQASYDRHADLGALTVTISGVSPNRGHLEQLRVTDLAAVLDALIAAFPSRVRSYRNRFGLNQHATTLTVPAVVVAWLEALTALTDAATLTLAPAGQNTAAVLETLGRLRQDSPGMSLPTALAAARGICAGPAAA